MSKALRAYRVHAYADGTRFVEYLREVTVIAISEDEALAMVDKWLEREGFSFIRTPEIELIGPALGVVSYQYEADY